MDADSIIKSPYIFSSLWIKKNDPLITCIIKGVTRETLEQKEYSLVETENGCSLSSSFLSFMPTLKMASLQLLAIDSCNAEDLIMCLEHQDMACMVTHKCFWLEFCCRVPFLVLGKLVQLEITLWSSFFVTGPRLKVNREREKVVSLWPALHSWLLWVPRAFCVATGAYLGSQGFSYIDEGWSFQYGVVSGMVSGMLKSSKSYSSCDMLWFMKIIPQDQVHILPIFNSFINTSWEVPLCEATGHSEYCGTPLI